MVCVAAHEWIWNVVLRWVKGQDEGMTQNDFHIWGCKDTRRGVTPAQGTEIESWQGGGHWGPSGGGFGVGSLHVVLHLLLSSPLP